MRRWLAGRMSNPNRCAECLRLADHYESLLKHLEVFVDNCARMTGPAFERQIHRIESLKAECEEAAKAIDKHRRDPHHLAEATE